MESSSRTLTESHSCSGEGRGFPPCLPPQVSSWGDRSEEIAQLSIGGRETGDSRPCLGAYGEQPDPGTVGRERDGARPLVVPQGSSGPASPFPTTCSRQLPSSVVRPSSCFLYCFLLVGCRPHQTCSLGLFFSNGDQPASAPHCGDTTLTCCCTPPESSWEPVSPAGSARSLPRSPGLLSPQQPGHHTAKKIIWIIFMGLKLGWGQMGCEPGIWGWVSTPPIPQSSKKPSLAPVWVRGQQRSGWGQGAGTIDQEEKMDGSLTPYVKVSRPHPYSPPTPQEQ